MKPTVLVLCGGKSAERLVSLVSAQCVVANLSTRKFKVRLVHIDENNEWAEVAPAKLLKEKPADLHRGGASLSRLRAGARSVDPWKLLTSLEWRKDCVFPVLHGPMGEDGTMQGLLELTGCAYVGCGVLGSAAGMDKEATKRVCASAGIPQVPWAVARTPAEAEAAAKKLGYPVFVKPARMGSSVGVVKVKSAAGIGAAMREALRYDDKALVEKGLPVREIETAVLGDPWAPRGKLSLRASVCAEIKPNAEFYDYKAKYLDPDGASFLVPAPLPASVSTRVREVAMAAFRALDLYGLARADFFVHKATGAVYFNEPNTLPGFTPASMYPRLWRESGVPTPKLVETLVALGLKRAAARRKISTRH